MHQRFQLSILGFSYAVFHNVIVAGSCQIYKSIMTSLVPMLPELIVRKLGGGLETYKTEI